jgi:hypothetical protein
LALQFIEREDVQVPFVLQEQVCSVSSLFKRYENVPASLADAALIRLAEINDSPLLLTTDSDFQIYRRNGRLGLPQFYGQVSRRHKHYIITSCLAFLKGNGSRITDGGMEAFPIVISFYPHQEIV